MAADLATAVPSEWSTRVGDPRHSQRSDMGRQNGRRERRLPSICSKSGSWNGVRGPAQGATTIIGASPEVIFAILADPAKHAAIDGTGWVAESPDDRPLTAVGQIFRMTMYHANHPDGNNEMGNRIQVFEPPNAISWEPGYDAGDGSLRFGGWTWRYDLTPAGPSETKVTLTYDWSAVPGSLREHIGIPPFPPDHLGNSLAHLADLATS